MMFAITTADLSLTGWTIVVGAVGNVACALLGCYLVLRRMSLMGDAISHAVLPGIALAFLLSGQIRGWPMILGAMLVGVLTSFLTQSVHQLGKVPEDASMGVVFVSLFAVGVILISTNHHARGADLDVDCVLMGNIENVPLDSLPGLESRYGWRVPRALSSMLPALLLTFAFILLFWKELKVVSFDPALATAMGINAALVHYALMAMVAGVTVVSFEAIGSILVVAMLIVPGATAHLLTDRLSTMLLLAAGVAVFASVFGAGLGLFLDISVAGMMAVGAGLAFVLAVFFAPRHGILSKSLHNARLGLRILCEDIIARLYRMAELPDEADRAETVKQRLSALWSASGGLLGWLAIRRLKQKGEIAATPEGGIELTAAGRRRAESIVRAHRLWEAYLEKDLDLPTDHLHEPAERMEHYIGPALQTELEAQLGQPGVDPHGRSIPPAPPALQ
jgi:manganese/zinc/iron transport system permease protein